VTPQAGSAGGGGADRRQAARRDRSRSAGNPSMSLSLDASGRASAVRCIGPSVSWASWYALSPVRVWSATTNPKVTDMAMIVAIMAVPRQGAIWRISSASAHAMPATLTMVTTTPSRVRPSSPCIDSGSQPRTLAASRAAGPRGWGLIELDANGYRCMTRYYPAAQLRQYPGDRG